MVETHVKPEGAEVAHAADTHLKNRRQELDGRLRKWAKWFVGGAAANVAGWALSFSVPLIGVPLCLAGFAAETVGAVGMTGNILKYRSNKNR